MTLLLHPAIPVDRARKHFHKHGRVEVKPFLSDASADLLRQHLLNRSDWRLVLNARDEVFEIDRADWRDMPTDQKARLERMVIERARSDFQFRFETIRVADRPSDRRASATLLDDFAQFMSSSPVLDLLMEITGLPGMAFADAQATSYGPGDFLTRHDDDVSGKNRKAAYVLGLTPQWRAEWGGLLMFHSDDERLDEVFVPAMGALRLFRVPVQHSVSYVTPIAPEPRLAVTGWLRAVAPEETKSGSEDQSIS